MSELKTTAAVIEELGGVVSVAELTGRKYDAAWNWKSSPHFPPDTYLILKKALDKRGHTAPPSLWRMVEA